MHGNVLINMLHNYSRGKKTSLLLAFSDDATTQKRLFKVDFLHLLDVNDQNNLSTFKDLICVFLKMLSFVSLSRLSCKFNFCTERFTKIFLIKNR